jgi:hypothetical protein
MTIDSQNATAFSYRGDWQVKSDANVPNSRDPAPFHQTTSQGSSVSVTFSGRAVSVNGPTSLGSGLYSVVSNDLLDMTISILTLFLQRLDDKETTLNASSSWSVPDTMLFYHDGLDESKEHTLNITNIGENGTPLSLSSVTVYGQGYPNSSTVTPS